MKERIAHVAVFFSFILVFLPLLAVPPIHADDRTENIDVFLVVDKSLSMEEEIAGVKDYIVDSVIQELLIPGDHLVIVVFYGEAERLMSLTVTEDRTQIVEDVQSIRADGRFTDIGNALDKLKETVPQEQTEGRRKYLMLITDGIQEAPPESKYYSADGSFNHEFLQNTKDIVMEGWKVHILGIGAATAAKDIAEELSGTYSEVPESPEKEDFDEETRDFLSIVEVVGDVSVRRVGASGETRISLTLRSSGYTETQDIVVSAVRASVDGTELPNVLAGAYTISIEPNEEKSLTIPIQLPDGLEPGRHDGSFQFVFGGKTSFTPAAFSVNVVYKSFLGNHIWIIPVAVLVLLAIVALVIAAVKGAFGGGKLGFVCAIEDGPTRQKRYTIKFGNKLYLMDGVMGLNIVEQPGDLPAGELTADKNGLHLSVAGKTAKAVSDIPANVIGSEVKLKKKNGKKATIAFRKG